MKTIELSTGTLLVVYAPNGIKVGLYGYKTGYWIKGTLNPDDAQYGGQLPPGPWQLLGHPSEITGEVWGMVVEVYSREHPVRYIDYTEPGYNYYQADLSGLSLCAAHNIQESDVLLFKPKEAVQESGSDPVCNEVTKKELSQLLNDVYQVLGGFSMDEVWSEWDESVKKRVVEMQKKIIQS